MTYKFPSTKQFLGLLLVLIALISYIYMPKRSQTVIRLHDDQIELQNLTNAISAFIIKNGYGYQVEMVECTIKEARNLLLGGDIDITLELWRENNLLWLKNAQANQLVTDLGEMYNGGKQYWIVSKWYAEKYQIQTVFDMRNHWQDFLDPDDPSKGLFFNCIYGWTCRDINRVKLQAYGLDKYYNTVSPVSPKSLKSIYAKAQTRKLPVFGYYWEPNSIMSNNNWHILEEPAYNPEVWLKVIEAASSKPNGERLHEACSFNDSGAHKIANSQLAGKAPDVFQMFKKMKIDMELFNRTFLNNKSKQLQRLSVEELAQHFLQDYPEEWSSWVSPKIQQKVIKALQTTTHTNSAER